MMRLAGLAILIWLVIGLYPMLVTSVVKRELTKEVVQIAGTFGDAFGAANALFSALAFVGVAYAVVLQGRERRDARLGAIVDRARQARLAAEIASSNARHQGYSLSVTLSEMVHKCFEVRSSVRPGDEAGLQDAELQIRQMQATIELLKLGRDRMLSDADKFDDLSMEDRLAEGIAKVQAEHASDPLVREGNPIELQLASILIEPTLVFIGIFVVWAFLRRGWTPLSLIVDAAMGLAICFYLRRSSQRIIQRARRATQESIDKLDKAYRGRAATNQTPPPDPGDPPPAGR